MGLLTSLLQASLSSCTPILLAALGGMFTYYANVFNIAMEGMMLIGAYFAVLGSYFFGSWIVGTLFALISGLVTALVFAFFAIYLKTDEFITGIGVNMLALGGTTYLLRNTFGVKGAFISPEIISLPRLDIPLLKDIPLLGDMLNGHPILVYIALVAAIGAEVLVFRTRFGLRLRATGEDSETTRSVGVNPERTKLWSIILSGLFSSLAGVYLSLGYVTLFSENMSNGRGWISLAIIILVRGRPLGILGMSLIFGFFEGLGLVLQNSDIPPQFTSMIPYIATLFALYVYSKQKKKEVLNS